MKLTCKAIVVGIIFTAIVLSVPCVATVPTWMIRTGTVSHAFSLSDGEDVYLDAEVVDKIMADDGYFTVHECFSSADRLIVLTQPPAELRRGMIVDVEGDLTTLPNGDRALVNVTVLGYADKDGNLLRHGPLVKGVFQKIAWPYMIDLTVSSESILTDTSGEPNDSPAEKPSYYESIGEILTGESAESPICRPQSLYDGIPDVQGLPDGSLVELQCKRIIGSDAEIINSVTYNYVDIAEDLPATDWIRAYCIADTFSNNDRVNRITGQVRHVNSVPVICVDDGPDYDPQILEGHIQTAIYRTIPWAKTFEDTTTLPASLENKIVSRAFPSAGYLYVQESGRESGVRVYNQTMAQIVQPGDIVSISGTVSTQDGERMITGTVSTPVSGPAPNPIGMNNRWLGGGAFNVYTPGITGSSQTNNVGLLVETWGKVISVGPDYFYIDDGAGIGVKVSWSWLGSSAIVAPEENWLVCVTGISGCEVSGQNTVPVLRVRGQEDIHLINPQDDNLPVVTIDHPGSEIHKPAGVTTINIDGTASDADTSIVKVEVAIVSGLNASEPASGWSIAVGTESWQYDWTNVQPGNYTIWVRAADFTGNVGKKSQNVVVTNVTIVYVKPNGNDNNNGSSWDLAKKTVQAGLNAAYAMNPKGEVWVKSSTYVECITLKSGVELYGGFAGEEISREGRNWRTNETILDGNKTGSTVTITVPNCQINGFVIQNGGNNSYLNGGGISCVNASAIISHNVIRNNTVNRINNYGSALGGFGGGLYAINSTLTIVNNIFVNNSTTGYEGNQGGAIYFTNTNGYIVNNTIVSNASYYAGGIAVGGNTLAIDNNIIAFNTRGGLYTISGSPNLHSNNVYSNTMFDYSGQVKGPGDISEDPMFISKETGDFRLTMASPCIDAGWDSASAIPATDMDGQKRSVDIVEVDNSGVIDMGADESDESGYYYVTLSTEPAYSEPGGSVTVTAHVMGWNGVPANHVKVSIVITDGVIQAITNGLEEPGVVDDPPLSGYGYTDADGNLMVTVTRDTPGVATVTASVDRVGVENRTTAKLDVGFYLDESTDWPMFMHDSQHTGMNPTIDSTPETLALAWWAQVPTASTTRTDKWLPHNQPGGSGAGYIFKHPYIDSSPVVVGNKVVVGAWTSGDYFNATGCVKAFNGEIGDVLWTASGNPSMGGVASTACIVDGKVYIGTTNGYLYCLDLATGDQLWAQPTYDRSSPTACSKIIASPVVYDGIVYIGNEAAKIYAFDATTGALQQGYPVVLPIEGHISPPGSPYTLLDRENMTGTSSPAIATVNQTDYLLFGCDDGYLYRLTLGASDPQSSLIGANLTYCVESSPTVVGNEVYVGISRYGGSQVYRLSVEPFQSPYGVDISGQECRATLAYDGNGFFYVGVDTGNTFHKLVADTLAEEKKFTAPLSTDYFVGSAAVCQNGLVYVGNDGGVFRAVAIKDLLQSASYNAGTGYICSSPAIAYNVDENHNRWVYVTTRNLNGRLLAFKTIR